MSVEERFWARVDTTGDCWTYTGPKNRLGYGVAGHKALPDRSRFAHRYAWQVTNGPIPEGMRVLHRCDNPPCVNPDHLWLGTIADNNRDRKVKGRSSRGQASHLAKVDVDTVRAIRAERVLTQRQMAAKYGIHRSQVQRIVYRVDWAHVA